jgi:hypothetical protein
MKMEFRWELEHPEECIKEDNPARPTKKKCILCQSMGRAHSVEHAAADIARYFRGELPGVT